MRIWFDTEFIDDGKTIEMISIGMVRDDGATLYMENSSCDLSRCDDWLRKNVVAKLDIAKGNHTYAWHPTHIGESIRAFAGPKPDFWAYYADYDWVVLCQLYGRMIDLPTGWPMYCRDLKQELVRLGNPEIYKLSEARAHNALSDAEWLRDTHLKLERGEMSAAREATFNEISGWTNEQRYTLLSNFCSGCGDRDLRCTCRRDE